MTSSSGSDVTTICLVRHGESTWNAKQLIQGQLDPPLSELGIRQAKRVAERLSKKDWSALYCSDLARAKSTAEAIGKKTSLTPKIEGELRERGQGKREGLPIQEARTRYPDPDAPEV